MQSPTPQYKLSVSVITPKVVTEGVNFNIVYKVKNIGDTSFPGGQVIVAISWASLDEIVNQPIEITKQLLPNEEMEEKKYSQAPLMSGYTWFHVAFAKASDNNPVVVFNTGGTQMWPYVQVASGTTIQYLKQPLAAVRARTQRGSEPKSIICGCRIAGYSSCVSNYRLDFKNSLAHRIVR